MADPVLIAVTDHAADRFRQRVRGTLDPKAEVTGRVGRAWQAGSLRPGPPDRRGTVDVLDLDDRSLVYVCRHDRPRSELVVVTLWEQGGGSRVPRRYTDALDR